MDKNNETILVDHGMTPIGRRTWKDAFSDKALCIHAMTDGYSRGYRIAWYLWSADIWFGKFPLLKFILAVNIAVWVLQFVF